MPPTVSDPVNDCLLAFVSLSLWDGATGMVHFHSRGNPHFYSLFNGGGKETGT
jgi:hypothetical protein